MKELAEQLEAQYNYQEEPQDDNVGYGRDDMSVASRELLANDGVNGFDVESSTSLVYIDSTNLHLYRYNGLYLLKN